MTKQSEFIDIALQKFAAARSLDEGCAAATNLLLPLVPQLTTDHVRRVVKAYLENSQLNGTTGTEPVMIEVFEQTNQHAEATRDIWIEIYEYVRIWGGRRYRRDASMREGRPLFKLIEERYPEVLDLIKSEKIQQGLS